MKAQFPLFPLLFGLFGVAHALKCPDGDDILVWGIDAPGKRSVVDEHNKHRRDVASGKVPGQPKGKNVCAMSFDDDLSREAQIVSRSCEMAHNVPADGRWKHVGQNLYMSWSSEKCCEQNWTEAVTDWYDEYRTFKYPKRSSGNGHYTQLIWHDSSCLGCDFVCFYDSKKRRTPYAKLYTCNYGPGGNIGDLPPYDLA